MPVVLFFLNIFHNASDMDPRPLFFFFFLLGNMSTISDKKIKKKHTMCS